MHRLYDYLLTNARGRTGRLAAGVLIGMLLAATAIAKEPAIRTTANMGYAAAGGAGLGFTAVAVLEGIDAQRERRVALGLPHASFGERALGCCVVGGMIIGLLSVLCGVVMFIVKTLEEMRHAR